MTDPSPPPSPQGSQEDELRALRAELEELRRALRERHAESPSDAQRQQLGAVLQALPDLVFFLTPDGIVVDYEASATFHTDLPPERFLGRRMAELVAPDAARLLQEGLDAMARGEQLHVVEYALEQSERTRWYEGRFAPLAQHTVVLVVRDITPHMEAQRRLQETTARLTAIVAALPDWMVVVGHDETIRSVQAPAAGDAPYATLDVEQLMGRRLRDVVPPELVELALGILNRLRTGERAAESLEFEWEVLGERRFFQARVVPCGEDAVLGLFRDLTSLRRELEWRTELRVDQLEQEKREALGVLAGGVAHDFNNILTGVMGNVGLARMEAPPSTSLAESLREIERAAQRGAALSRQMLAFSGQGRFLVGPTDLSRVIRDALARVAHALPSSARLVVDLADDLPPAQCDAEQVKQALMALIENAVESLRAGFGTVRVSTALTALDEGLLRPPRPAGERVVERPGPGRYVTLTVQDDGTGMDAATLSRACDPFFSQRFVGRGLGLPAVLGIVRGHGGGLVLQSTPGHGTAVTLYFPVEPPEEPTHTQIVAGDGGAHPDTRRGARVLVVDDEELVLSVAKRSLEAAGFQVSLARDGLEALAQLRRAPTPIKLVILDLTMPRMGGVETFAKLRHAAPWLPIILSSGYSQQEAMAQLSGQELAGFLQKPYRPSTLRTLVREVLARGLRAEW